MMDHDLFCQEYERTRDEEFTGRNVSNWGTYDFLTKKKEKKETKGYSPLWIKYLKRNNLPLPKDYKLKGEK
jgi:hypothetical protein